MTDQRCRSIDIEYAAQVWSNGPEESAKALGLSAPELIASSNMVFNAVVRSNPLEVLDVIGLGDDGERDTGMERVPDDVFAQLYALTYGIDADEFLEQPTQHRRAYLECFGDIPPSAMQNLEPMQLNQFYEHIAEGCCRRIALARVMNDTRAH